MRRVGLCLALWASWTALAGPGRTLAHTELDRGKRLASELEFQAALGAFEQALESGSLSRAELVELLSERILLHYALRADEALSEDFVWLSALDPDYRLDLRAPPELVVRWGSVRDRSMGALRLELTAEVRGPELAAQARLAGTVPEHVQSRLHWRRGAEPWRTLETAELHEALDPGEQVELYAEAIGLGQTVVAAHYSELEPLRVERMAAESTQPPWDSSGGASEPHRTRRKWLIGSACALAAAALVATVLLVRARQRDPENRTELTPGVEF